MSRVLRTGPRWPACADGRTGADQGHGPDGPAQRRGNAARGAGGLRFGDPPLPSSRVAALGVAAPTRTERRAENSDQHSTLSLAGAVAPRCHPLVFSPGAEHADSGLHQPRAAPSASTRSWLVERRRLPLRSRMRANCLRVAMLAVLAGCGAPQSPANSPPAVEPSADQVAASQASHGGDASYKNINFERMLGDLDKAIEPNKASAAAQAESPLTPAQIAAQASKSVVVIKTPSGTGAGFVVAPNLVATCLHVVAGAHAIVVRTEDGIEHGVASVVAYDQPNDLAVLSTDDIAAPQLQLGDFAAVEPGDPVTVIGHPRGLESSVSTGVVSGVRKLDSARQLLQITAPISPGSSGGPVFSQTGRVIGLTRSFLRDGQELNFAVPVAALRGLLASETAPIALAQFAEMTTVKNEPQRPAAPVSAPPPAPALPTFPTTVAGFSFGMTRVQAELACTTSDNQNLKRLGLTWYTLLQVDGVYGSCPFVPEPLDFVKSVRLQFAAGQLVQINLYPTSIQLARERVSGKYGAPGSCLVDDKWIPGSLSVRPKEAGCYWNFAGGTVYVLKARPPIVAYVSDNKQELEKQGF